MLVGYSDKHERNARSVVRDTEDSVHLIPRTAELVGAVQAPATRLVAVNLATLRSYALKHTAEVKLIGNYFSRIYKQTLLTTATCTSDDAGPAVCVAESSGREDLTMAHLKSPSVLNSRKTSFNSPTSASSTLAPTFRGFRCMMPTTCSRFAFLSAQ